MENIRETDNTYLATQMEVSADVSTMDAHVKNVLAIKPVLARIIQGTVSEVANYSPDEIEGMLEGDPQVDTVPVDPGLSNHPKIEGKANDESIPFEGEVRYDLLTHIRIPGEEEYVKIIINVEGQRDSSPGYDLVTRGVYYGARQISSQKGVEFSKSNYDDIKKVYSIWICFDADEDERNTITEYSMSKNDVYGTSRGTERYDLLSIVFIRIGGPIELYEDKTLQKFLMYLFSEKLTFEEKQRKLSVEYGILMAEKSRKEVRDMGSYGAGLYAEGVAEGMAKGVAEGKAEGRAEERMETIGRLRKIGISDEQLLLAGYTKEEIEKQKRN